MYSKEICSYSNQNNNIFGNKFPEKQNEKLKEISLLQKNLKDILVFDNV